MSDLNVSSISFTEVPRSSIKMDSIHFDKLELEPVEMKVSKPIGLDKRKISLGKGRFVPVPDSLIQENVIGQNGIIPPKQLKVEVKKVPALLTPQINIGKLRVEEKSNGRIKTLDMDNGLSSSSVKSLCQDDLGNVWMGSGNGIYVFDGQLIRNFTLREGLIDINIWSILKAKNGDVWIGTEKGLMRYDGHDFYIYNSESGFFTEEVYGIAEDKSGNIWVILDGIGLCKFTGKDFELYANDQGLMSLDLSGVMVDNKDHIWLITLSGRLIKFDGERFVSFDLDMDELGESFNLHHDNAGNIWLALFGGGIAKFDGRNFTYYTKEDGLPDNQIIDLLCDHQGTIWAGTYEGGVFHILDGQLEVLNQDNGLASNRVLSLMEDNVGNIWAGTSGGGVSLIQHSLFNYLTEEEGLLNYRVNGIFEDNKHNIWFSNFNGLSKLKGDTILNYSILDDNASNRILSMDIDKKERLWFTSDVYTYVLNGDQLFRLKSSSHYAKGGYVVKIDRNDNVWLGFTEGLQKIAKNQIVTFSGFGKTEILEILSIVEDRNGCLWMGTNGDGLFKLENGKIYKVNFTNELDTKYVNCIMQSNEGNICFGTNGGGVFFLNQNTVTQMNKAFGLSHDCVFSIVQDDMGRIWAGTEKGLNCMSKLNGKWNILKYYNSDGLISDSFLPNSVSKDSKGRLWWGTYKGVVMLDANNFFPSSAKPKIYLRDISINDQFVDFSLEKYSLSKKGNAFWFDALNLQQYGVFPFSNYPSTLDIPFEFNHATFQFSAIDWYQPNKLTYQYKMEGLDEDWSAMSTELRADYRNIPEGNYHLRLRAMSAAGVMSEELSYPVLVHPPIYRTWCAYVVYAITIVVFIILVIRRRENNLRRNQLRLEKKVVRATLEIRKQKRLIENKHAEISDSILYAERIQRGLLASEKLLKKFLADFFIYYLPKDVVSGDFYWATSMENKFLLVTADSTGHGVPGAIMSTLNIACIKEALQTGHRDPHSTLDETRRLVIENLFDESTGSYGMDGMDCSLLELDFNAMQLRAACANNAIWIFRSGQCIELKADRYPIGKHNKDQEPFTLHTMTLLPSDVIYTFTDGFADQFGGPKGKKFNKKQLRELLLSICHLPLSEQKLKLSSTFEQWRGELEQIDDITIIGVKVS